MTDQNSKIREKEVQDIFKSIELKSSKDFSEVLNKFKKKYTNYGPLYDKDGRWNEVVEKCLDLFIRFRENVHAKYNLLRFIRLLSANSFVLETYYQEIFSIYSTTVFDDNGNIRNAGFRIIENAKMGVLPASKKNIARRDLRESWMFLFFELLRIEKEYTQDNKDSILRSDRHGRRYRKWSTETKDKYLKNIRRAIEEIDRGYYFDRILEEFGYLEDLRTKEQLMEYYEFKNH